jgi:hypothetical protein
MWPSVQKPEVTGRVCSTTYIDHDLSFRASGFDIVQRLFGFLEREDPVDHRPDVAGFDQPAASESDVNWTWIACPAGTREWATSL